MSEAGKVTSEAGKAMSGAGTVAQRVLGLFGGPWGIAISAAAVGIGYLVAQLCDATNSANSFVSAQNNLRDSVYSTCTSVDDLSERYRNLSDDMAAVEKISLETSLRKTREGVKKLRDELSGASSSLLRDLTSMLTSTGFEDDIPERLRQRQEEIQKLRQLTQELSQGRGNLGEFIEALKTAGRAGEVGSEQINKFLEGNIEKFKELLKQEGNAAGLAEALETLNKAMEEAAGAGDAAQGWTVGATSLESLITRAAAADDAAPGIRELAAALRELEVAQLYAQAAARFDLMTQDQFAAVNEASLGGALTGSTSFNGSANVTITGGIASGATLPSPTITGTITGGGWHIQGDSSSSVFRAGTPSSPGGAMRVYEAGDSAWPAGVLIASNSTRLSALINETTANGANVHASATTGRVFRSTSAAKYKREVEPLEFARAVAFLEQAQPVWYRSACAADPDGWSWYGYLADDVAAIEPRLVQFGEDGAPEGFAYDRVAALLHLIVKDNRARIQALEDRLRALEEGTAP